MIKTYYKEIEDIRLRDKEDMEGMEATEYEVIKVDEEDILKQYDLQGLITVPAGDGAEDDIENYNYEIEGFELLENEMKEYVILDPELIPEKIKKLIESYDRDIDNYNDSMEERITQNEVDIFTNNIDKYVIDKDTLESNKVVMLWDGSNWQTIMLESPWFDVDWTEDEDGMFDNLTELDREPAGAGYTEVLLKNEYSTFIKTISQWQGDLTTTYHKINNSIQELDGISIK